MEDGGWIKLHRKFLNWEWRDTPEMVSLWVHILLEANHEDRKWHGIIIGRGQIVTSLVKLSQLTGLSVRQIRTGLSRMEQTGEISKKTTNSYTLITISNYERYQVRDDDVRQTSDTRSTNERQTNDNPTTTNKNIKKERIYNTLPLEEAPPEKISPDWKHVSSVQRSALGFDKDRIAEFKGQAFAQQVGEIARDLGMTEEQQDAFIRYWTEHNPGNERLKAEYETTFDIRRRMRTWMDRDRPTARPQQGKSKIQGIVDERNKFQDQLNGIFDHISADGYPDSQFGQ